MHRVDGIGGFFFKADDPAALARWYADHLGVEAPPASYDDEVWRQAGGATVFAPFGAEHGDSPHLGAGGWGLNFRVTDLDGMVEQLRAAGVAVDVDDEVYRALARRAAEADLTVPELLRREAARWAARPTMTEWLERTRRRSSDVTRAEVLEALDEIRGPWPDDGG